LSPSISAPSKQIRGADYACPNSCPSGCCDEEGWVCCSDGAYCAATLEDCPISALGTLAVTSKPLFDPTVCEGTECPAGCCPGENWFCCPDNLYCASTAEYCPSAAADLTEDPTTIAGVAFDPADYFDTSKPPMRFISGATAGEFVVPEWLGFNRAVYINAQGNITNQYVAPRQIIRFQSTIVLGYDPDGYRGPTPPPPPSFSVDSVGNVETGPVYNVTVDPVESATGYVFRFNGTAIRPNRIGPAPATTDGWPAITEGQYQYLQELDGYAMTAASTNGRGTGSFSEPVQIGLTPCDFGAEYTSCAPGQDCCSDGKCRSLCGCSDLTSSGSANSGCPNGLCCKEGNCVECCDPPCPSGQCCVNSVCGECCDPPCDEKACQQCKDGECYDWCTPSGGTCSNGECSVQCVTDSDCGEGPCCVGGKCDECPKYPCENQGFPEGTCIDKHYIDTTKEYDTAGVACPAICREPPDCECPKYPCENQGFPEGTCIDKHYIDTTKEYDTAGVACPAICREPPDCECECDPKCDACSKCVNGGCEDNCPPGECCNGESSSCKPCKDCDSDADCGPCGSCKDGKCGSSCFEGQCCVGGKCEACTDCKEASVCWFESNGSIETYCCPEGLVCSNGQCVKDTGSSSSS
jgi:hypothetical protein